MVQAWGVLAAAGEGALLHEVLGDTVKARHFASMAKAEQGAGLEPGRLLRFNAPELAPPAPVLPEGAGALGALRQGRPAALLPPEARILIAGALAKRPNWDGIICLRDVDVTHWVHVSASEIVSFQGVATGRLAAAFAAGEGFDQAALSDTLARPERLAAQLNAASLDGDGARVIGHLLGAELAAMRVYWLGQGVIIIDAGALYHEALQALGVEAENMPRAQAWQAGLMALGRAAGFVT